MENSSRKYEKGVITTDDIVIDRSVYDELYNEQIKMFCKTHHSKDVIQTVTEPKPIVGFKVHEDIVKSWLEKKPDILQHPKFPYEVYRPHTKRKPKLTYKT